MRKIVSILFMLAAVAGAPAWPQDSGLNAAVRGFDPRGIAGRQYLLLVAVDAYKNWPRLEGRVAGARELKILLTDRYYFEAPIELYDAAATKSAVLKALANLQARLGPKDSLLVYFSGHAVMNKARTAGFWIPADAGTEERAQATWLAQTQVRELLSKMKAAHVLLLSDGVFAENLVTAAAPAHNAGLDSLRLAYARPSRQVFAVSDPSAVSRPPALLAALHTILTANTEPYTDALALLAGNASWPAGSIQVTGALKDAGHNDGGSFVLFRRAEALPVDVYDEFNGPALGKRWRWVREDAALRSLKDPVGRLSLKTAAGGLAGNMREVKNIALTDTEGPAFEVETRLYFAPRFNVHAAGLVIYRDDDNFVRLVFKFERQAMFEFGGKAAGEYRQRTRAIDPGALSENAPVYLRLRKAGDTYAASVSFDGKTFIDLGEWTVPLGERPGAGLYAVNEGGIRFSPEISAGFDYLRITYAGTKVPVKETQAPSPAAYQGFDVRFDQPELDRRFSWVREARADWSLKTKPGFLAINAGNGDLFQAKNDGHNILLAEPPSGDFVLETKIEFSPTDNYQQAGLIVYRDDDNYVRLSMVYNEGNKIELIREAGGAASYKNTNYNQKAVFLRLVKKGDMYSGFYSTDGLAYDAVSEATVALGPVKVGVAAFNNAASTAPSALFAYLRCLTPTAFSALSSEKSVAEMSVAQDAFARTQDSAIVTVPPAADYGFTDDFSAPDLQPRWRWVREDRSAWSLTERPGFLSITTEHGDLYQSDNNNRNLILARTMLDEFTLEAKIEVALNSTSQQVGLVVYRDDDNYVKTVLEYRDGKQVVVAREVQGGLQSNAQNNINTSVIYLRIVKTGLSYTGSFSRDGETYFPAGTFTANLGLRPTVGLFAANGDAEAVVTARFDYCTLTPLAAP
jgi:beta-xylosidase